jgi:hypothetical protein
MIDDRWKMEDGRWKLSEDRWEKNTMIQSYYYITNDFFNSILLYVLITTGGLHTVYTTVLMLCGTYRWHSCTGVHINEDHGPSTERSSKEKDTVILSPTNGSQFFGGPPATRLKTF